MLEEKGIKAKHRNELMATIRNLLDGGTWSGGTQQEQEPQLVEDV